MVGQALQAHEEHDTTELAEQQSFTQLPVGRCLEPLPLAIVRSSGTLGVDVARDASLFVRHLAGPKCHPTKLLGQEAGKERATRNATVLWHRFRRAIIYACGEVSAAFTAKTDSCYHLLSVLSLVGS